MRAVLDRTLATMKRLVTIVVLGAVLSGCGGAKKPAVYSRTLTEACVRKHPGAKISHKVDFVASTADEGAFHVHMPSNDATVVFSASPEGATSISSAYIRFHAKNVGIEDILRTYKNVVVLWRLHPKHDDGLVILNCLK